MKKLMYFTVTAVITTFIFMQALSAFAQSPKVPITFKGDTPETIARRAQWIEGASKEGKLVWWGILRPNYKTKVIEAFNKVYPFIKVDHWRGTGEEMAAKVEAEFAGDHHTVDLVLGPERHHLPRWREKGILEKFTDIIPGIEKVDRRMYGKLGDWAVPGHHPITPQYNTNLVSAAEAPKSWEDLLDPKWKGKLGLTRDMKVWTGLAMAENGWGIEKTERFLRKLKEQKPIWARGHTAGHTLLIAGEFQIMVEDYLYHVLGSQKKGAPVEWIRVNPVPVSSTALILLKKAPHPDAANLFLEWLLSPEGLLTYEEITMLGVVFPGSGTYQSKILNGLDLAVRTEETILKEMDLGLMERFAKILGVE